jgi:subtilisin-like proprotein convertase family protein
MRAIARCRLVFILLVAALAGSALGAHAATTAFTNTDGIALQGNGTDAGRADPYPSPIVVSGVTEPVIKVTVSIAGFEHATWADLHVALVGPTGLNVMLMSEQGPIPDPGTFDCGFTDLGALLNTGAATGPANDVSISGFGVATGPFDFVFDDSGPMMPDCSMQIGDPPPVIPFASGTWRPTDGEPSVPAIKAVPGPSAPNGTTLSQFNGVDPNGTWNLFIWDTNNDPGTGSIDSWSLNFTTDGDAPVTTATPTPGPNLAGWNHVPVQIDLLADDGVGAGVASVTYEKSGAETAGPTVVSGDSASLTVSTAGETTITYFATDLVNNIETPQLLTVKLDLTAPTITQAPDSDLILYSRLDANRVPVQVGWDGGDNAGGSGMRAYQLQHKQAPGSYTNTSTSDPTSTSRLRSVVPNTENGFQVRAVDVAGNVSAYTEGASLLTGVDDDTAASIVYSPGWVTQPTSGAHGNATHATSVNGNTATISYIGADVALFASFGPNRGKLSVSVDGGPAVEVDLYAPAYQHRRAVFVANDLTDGPHTLVVTALGTKNDNSSGTRVDVDAVAYTRQP